MLSFTTIKDRLQAQIAPNNDVEFARLLQEADDRLLEFGRWNWTRKKLILTPIDNFVYLPEGYVSIYAARVGIHARDIHAEEFEFIADGVGEVPVNGTGDGRLIDQGFVTQVFDVEEETRRAYKVYGTLQDNIEVTVLARFAPANIVDCTDTPEDEIYTRCPDLAALKLAMLSIIYEEANEIEKSSQYMATALRTLDNKERSFRAGAKQTLKVSPFGNGVRGIRNLR